MSIIDTIKLTSLAQAAGCAAKLGPGDLSEVAFPLGKLFSAQENPNLLIGLTEPDDAAVYKLNDEQAIISTTDFFPPVVDHPYWFGAIAAANAMSDIYAMGGEVLMAINLVAFPGSLDMSILSEILRGGAEKVKEGGGVLGGGHTIMDDEPKYGLAVTGIVHPDKIRYKGGAQPGDRLVLTKPLGTGVITTALKNGVADDDYVQKAMTWMATLNRAASQAAQAADAHGMTDITGYGITGHAHEMARLSGTDFHIQADALPWMDGALEYAEKEIFPGGQGRNRGFYGRQVDFGDGVSDMLRQMAFDPQTSGGLLITTAEDKLTDLLNELKQRDVFHAVIGHVEEGSGRIKIS